MENIMGTYDRFKHLEEAKLSDALDLPEPLYPNIVNIGKIS